MNAQKCAFPCVDLDLQVLYSVLQRKFVEVLGVVWKQPFMRLDIFFCNVNSLFGVLWKINFVLALQLPFTVATESSCTSARYRMKDGGALQHEKVQCDTSSALCSSVLIFVPLSRGARTSSENISLWPWCSQDRTVRVLRRKNTAKLSVMDCKKSMDCLLWWMVPSWPGCCWERWAGPFHLETRSIFETSGWTVAANILRRWLQNYSHLVNCLILNK